jgi:hypothetical protein
LALLSFLGGNKNTLALSGYTLWHNTGTANLVESSGSCFPLYAVGDFLNLFNFIFCQKKASA